MLIKIHKDAATQIHKQVADLDEARAIAGNGFHVSIEQEDGSFLPLDQIPVETPLEEGGDTKPAAKKPAAKKK